jgi:hypothetical protein
LAAELGIPLIAKDTIKDALMATLGAPDLDASRRLGGASVTVMLALAREMTDAVLESAWHRSYAVDELRALNSPIVEVFCRCDRAIVTARYRARAGSRAGGHFDDLRTDEELWNDDVAEPVAGGWPVIEVDTSQPVDIHALARQILSVRVQ